MRRLFRNIAMNDQQWIMRKNRIKKLQIELLVLAVILTIANVVLELRIRSHLPPVGVKPPVLKRSQPEAIGRIRAVVYQVANEFHIESNSIRQKDDTYIIPIAKEMRFIVLYLRLKDQLRVSGGEISKTIDDRKKNQIEIIITVDDELAAKLIFLRKAAISSVSGRIAIIVDDFGYTYNDVVKSFIFFPDPLTLSIIPGLDETEHIVKEARLAKREILVHMPMEPLNEKYSDDGYTILMNQDKATIRLRIRQAFSMIPGAIGLNNHQGSKATTNREIMKTVLTEIKNEHKIFIDSHTSPETVALAVAKSLKVPTAANQVFIDAEDDETFIEKQLGRLEDMACKQGEVIGIAHVRKKSFDVLQRMIPDMQTRGIEFVYVSKVTK